MAEPVRARRPGRARRPVLAAVPAPRARGLGLWLLLGGFTINLLILVTLYGPLPNGATLTSVAALILALRLAYRRLLDLERARMTDRRALDLGPHARRHHVGEDVGARRSSDA